MQSKSMLAAALLWAGFANAAATVKSEYGEIKGGKWQFPGVAAPARSSLASTASLSIVVGKLHAESGSPASLVNGVVNVNAGTTEEVVFFDNACVDGGKLLMDLGKAQPIRQIDSYSYHTWNVDQGSRTPQVYSLYGSAADKADPADLAGWTKIAEVDSRPNQTGQGWGGHPHCVQIADAAGADLGSFRYLLFVIKPTLSPLLNGRQTAGEAWSNTFFTEINVHNADTLAKAVPAKLFTTCANLEEIILVYKSHFDIGYTHLAAEAVQGYRTHVIDGALAAVDKNKGLPPEQQFVWTVPGWPMKKMLEDWPGQTPERLQRAKEAFKAGRFAVHALPFTMQTEMMEPEGMVRSLGFASKLVREAGSPLPTGAKMTDVPSHTKFLPTLLKNAGVSFLHLGCNPASQTPRVPLLFWWEGPDGSRLLTMYTPGYGGGLFPPANWKYKTWIAMNMAGDNQPPPSPDVVQSHIAQIKARFPGIKVRVGTISDFADRMQQEDLNDVPVVREDMPDTWIHGPMCNPDGVILARNAVPDLFAAESLHTLLGTWNIATPNPAQAIADGYENSVLFYEHTWGGAMYWIGRYGPDKNGIGQCTNWFYGDQFKADLKTKKFDRHIASWEEHTDYARNASKLVAAPLHGDLQALVKAVNVAGPRTIVFNPLPWQRDAVVNGTLVKHIPAGGYKTVSDKSDRSDKSDTSDKTTMENAVFRITVDPVRGTIKSLIDKRSGRELVDANAEHGFGQYLHEKFSANEVASYCKAYVRGGHDWGFVEIGKPNLPPAAEVLYRALTPADCALISRSYGDASMIQMRAAPKPNGINYPVTTNVILYANAPYVDLELTIEKPADNWPEAGWICLPFKVEAPQFRVGRNGFIMDPAKEIIAGANRHLYAVGTGVAVFDAKGQGAGVCGPDTPLVSLGVPGMWKFSNDYVPTKPAVYFNLFNNQWSTNYRFWNEGKWTYRFRIWSFDHYDAAASLITPALETRYPVQTATVTTPAGKLPKEQAGIAVSRPGTLVTAFGQNPDGKGTILRVWEQAGISGKLTVTIPGKFTTATPVNLRGEKTGEPVKFATGKLVFDLKAYAPASFVLE
jgi:hypothetical protein